MVTTWTISMRYNPIRHVLTLCLAVGLTAQAGEAPFTGRFLGIGRACHGMLAVRTKTISWLTSFSQCQALPYELVERTDSGTLAHNLALHTKHPGLSLPVDLAHA